MPHPGLTFNIRDPKSLGEQDETFTDEDDRNFPCDDCKLVTNNEEAHAQSCKFKSPFLNRMGFYFAYKI
jgi:hypothetical protein